MFFCISFCLKIFKMIASARYCKMPTVFLWDSYCSDDLIWLGGVREGENSIFCSWIHGENSSVKIEKFSCELVSFYTFVIFDSWMDKITFIKSWKSWSPSFLRRFVNSRKPKIWFVTLWLELALGASLNSLTKTFLYIIDKKFTNTPHRSQILNAWPYQINVVENLNKNL